MFKTTFRLVQEFVQNRHASAAVAVIQGQPNVHASCSFGTLSHFPGSALVTDSTVFDIASLTKVVATTPSTLLLVERGLLSLQTRLGSLYPACPKDKADITIEQLLTHTSGLPQVPIYTDVASVEDAIPHILHLELQYAPGTQTVYTCLGFILLGDIVEKCTGQNLAAFSQEQIFEPLEMVDTCFNPEDEVKERCAYTEWRPETRVFAQGRVHDENCFTLGGATGNAGLFSTGGDLAKFSTMMIQDGGFGGKQILQPRTLRLLRRDYTAHLGESRTLGWMMKGVGPCSGGDLIAHGSLGHTGFTGTSIWLDFELSSFFILLTNRVHPSRNNEGIVEFRRIFHNAAVTELQQLYLGAD